MPKTTEKVNLNFRVPKKLKDDLQRLADTHLAGNLSNFVTLVCQDFIDQKRQITIGGKKEENHAE